MTDTFDGAVVAHFEARRTTDLDRLITRHGGIPWSAPALSEVPVAPDAAARAALERLSQGAFDVIVLLTGVGTRRLFAEAPAVGDALARMSIVCRGPKPVF